MEVTNAKDFAMNQGLDPEGIAWLMQSGDAAWAWPIIVRIVTKAVEAEPRSDDAMALRHGLMKWRRWKLRMEKEQRTAK